MIVEYIQNVLIKDRAAGNELIRLNSKLIADELGITEEELKNGPKKEKT